MPRDGNSTVAITLVERLLRDTGSVIDPHLRRHSATGDRDVQLVINHALRPRGVRERPLLVRLSCEAVGGRFDRVLPAAVAVELFHFSTLVTDDILDESRLRGGVGSVQAVYGAKAGIVVAELLCAAAFRCMATLADNGTAERNALRALSVLAGTYDKLYRGQYLDLVQERDLAVDEHQYIRTVTLTTGSLVECSTAVGAILGGGSEAEVRALARFGKELGVAMQIRDDLVELVGDADVIGRPLGGDIRQGKMRLPLIRALRTAKGPRLHFLRRVIRSRQHPSRADIRRCVSILKTEGAVTYSMNMVKRYCDRAVRRLRACRVSPAKQSLCAFAEVISSVW